MTTSTHPKVVGRLVVDLPPIVHAENPNEPGYACGIPLSGRHASASRARCVVCIDISRRDRFTDR